MPAPGSWTSVRITPPFGGGALGGLAPPQALAGASAAVSVAGRRTRRITRVTRARCRGTARERRSLGGGIKTLTAARKKNGRLPGRHALLQLLKPGETLGIQREFGTGNTAGRFADASRAPATDQCTARRDAPVPIADRPRRGFRRSRCKCFRSGRARAVYTRLRWPG